MIRLCRFALPLAFLFVLAGCDSGDADDNGGGDTFFLDPERVAFEFEFDGDDLTPGQFTELSSEGTQNLRTYIESSAFALDDVVAVRLREGSGVITVARPSDVSIDFIDRARLRLQQGTSAALTVATDNDIMQTTSPRTAAIDVETTNLQTFATTGPFSALLDLDPAMAVEGNFLVTVTFDAVVEVRP